MYKWRFSYTDRGFGSLRQETSVVRDRALNVDCSSNGDEKEEKAKSYNKHSAKLAKTSAHLLLLALSECIW